MLPVVAVCDTFSQNSRIPVPMKLNSVLHLLGPSIYILYRTATLSSQSQTSRIFFHMFTAFNFATPLVKKRVSTNAYFLYRTHSWRVFIIFDFRLATRENNYKNTLRTFQNIRIIHQVHFVPVTRTISSYIMRFYESLNKTCFHKNSQSKTDVTLLLTLLSGEFTFNYATSVSFRTLRKRFA